ncbi:MAG: 5-(carboxyamino)imidazole ribonucleotide synthase [Actinobacteria bacterium]|nr:5-(carboxyamino)imidazole ribonucleotide synthase [Actinomycetota bacterium]
MSFLSAELEPLPGYPVVGMVGGGQLARMTHQAAIGLGIGFRVLSATPDDSAARVTREVMLGDPDSVAAASAFARACDVVTFDHEQVPPATLEAMAATGTPLRPSPDALIYAQDKLAMRRLLERSGLPNPQWAQVGSAEEATAFGEAQGWPIILKTSRGGYDGKGVWLCRDRAGVVSAFESGYPGAWLAEAYVPFQQELAVLVARSPSGQAVTYPVVRTVQTDGICTQVVAPAPDVSTGESGRAQSVALRIAELTGVTGLLAVEMFDTGDDVLVNELAMRPHNSGHWTMDGAMTSQFENHLRAVLDLPLGDPRPRAPWTVMQNILGGEPDMYSALKHVFAADPALRLHLYGKAVRPGRKVGHVNAYGDELDSCLDRAVHAADYISGVIDE